MPRLGLGGWRKVVGYGEGEGEKVIEKSSSPRGVWRGLRGKGLKAQVSVLCFVDQLYNKQAAG